MRIIGGSLRGKRLITPEGTTTRPTADRVREALFNILDHGRYRDLLRGGGFADLFAGSGAVGLEALSRGATRVIFAEKDAAALRALKANIATCNAAPGQARVLSGDAVMAVPPSGPVAIVFLDPPYQLGLASEALAAAVSRGWLAPKGVAIVQAHPKEKLAVPDGLVTVDERRYGAARLYFLEADANRD